MTTRSTSTTPPPRRCAPRRATPGSTRPRDGRQRLVDPRRPVSTRAGCSRRRASASPQCSTATRSRSSSRRAAPSRSTSPSRDCGGRDAADADAVVLPDGEHHATLDTVAWLDAHEGAAGAARRASTPLRRIRLDDVLGARWPGAAFATALVANNEVGTINDAAGARRGGRARPRCRCTSTPSPRSGMCRCRSARWRGGCPRPCRPRRAERVGAQDRRAGRRRRTRGLARRRPHGRCCTAAVSSGGCAPARRTWPGRRRSPSAAEAGRGRAGGRGRAARGAARPAGARHPGAPIPGAELLGDPVRPRCRATRTCSSPARRARRCSSCSIGGHRGVDRVGVPGGSARAVARRARDGTDGCRGPAGAPASRSGAPSTDADVDAVLAALPGGRRARAGAASGPRSGAGS